MTGQMFLVFSIYRESFMDRVLWFMCFLACVCHNLNVNIKRSLLVSLAFVGLVSCASDSSSGDQSMTTVQVSEVPVTTIPVTTTSVSVAPSTTAPKRQVATTVPAAPKTKTPVVTGTPSEILDKLRADVLAFEQKIFDSGNGDLYGKIGPLQKKYAGAATLTYNHDFIEGPGGDIEYTLCYYTGTSGDLTRIWDVEVGHYGDLVLVER